MSGTSTPGNAPTPKTMSSRLLTMKFMQRAASSSSPTTPKTPDEPPNKRRKKDSDATPPKFNVDALADERAVQKALADEEAKRQAALERQAAEAGDTRWVLSFEDQRQAIAAPALALRVVQTGYANLDSFHVRSARDEEGEDQPVNIGRRSFGKFNKVIEKQQTHVDDGSSESESSESDEDSSESNEDDDNDPSKGYYNESRANEATERLKKQRKAQKKKEQATLLKRGKERKKKEVNLNGLTSLSGRSGGAGPCHGCGGPHMKKDCPEVKSRACFNCGGPHLKKDCPELNGGNKRGFGGGDDGPPRKTVRAS